MQIEIAHMKLFGEKRSAYKWNGNEFKTILSLLIEERGDTPDELLDLQKRNDRVKQWFPIGGSRPTGDLRTIFRRAACREF